MYFLLLDGFEGKLVASRDEFCGFFFPVLFERMR